MNIGNQIYSCIERPDPQIIKAFYGLPSSNINDTMNRLFCMHDYIHLINPAHFSGSMVGPAFTVKVPQGDNLFIHQALDMAQPGDILIVDGGSGCNRSLAGELMLRFADIKGLSGVVIDGYVRDLDGLQRLSMPVYAMGITPEGPWKNGPGEINTPVSCGGQVVFPGDLIVGDSDGIVVVRKDNIEEVLKAAQKKNTEENASFEMMDHDPEAYKEKHRTSTLQRMQGKTPYFVN